MVPVVMRIKNVADGFVRVFSNNPDHLISLVREIRVDDQDKILKDNPPLVAPNKFRFCLGFSKEYAGGEFGHRSFRRL